MSPIQLSSDQLATLHRGEPLRLTAGDAEEIVVVLAEQYERLKQCVDFADADPRAVYPLIADVFPGDWGDLAEYPNTEPL